MLFVAAPERGTHIRRERQLVLQAIRQVGVRREVATKRDQICIAGSDDLFGAVAVKPAGGDDRTIEVRAQITYGDRRMALVQRIVALDARFDHVEISELVLVEHLRDMAERGFWVAVGDSAPFAGWGDAHADAVCAPYRNQRFDRFAKKAHAVLDRAAVGIRALVRAILNELVDEVAVRAVKFDTIEAGI